MAEREALWGWDLDESPADPTDHELRDGHEPSTEPIPVVDAEFDVEFDDQAFDEQPFDAVADDVDDRETSYARAFIDRPAGSPVGMLTFKPAPSPWYRRKPGAIALAVAAAAVVLVILPLLPRGPASTPEESGPGPAPPTSAGPAPSAESPPPSATRPTMSSPPAPPPPPPPPAPPPPPPAQDSAPAYTPYYPPRNSSPSRSNKPERDVTRAPMSVAPEIQAPPPNEADVGDGRPDRGFF